MSKNHSNWTVISQPSHQQSPLLLPLPVPLSPILRSPPTPSPRPSLHPPSPSCLLPAHHVPRIRQQETKNDNETTDTIKQFEDGFGNDLIVFDIDWLKGIERVEIGNDCLKKANHFVIDGLSELKSIIIGEESFKLSKSSQERSKCLIMNCDQLSKIHIGSGSFYWYESLELKNLPFLKSIQLDQYAFMKCHLIVFESMNE